MSDEAHFHLGGYVNKQNCCIRGSENPKMIIEKPLYPQRVTVWSGFWAGGIIGPELEDMDVDDVYFKQDGPSCNKSGEIIGLLSEKFPGQVNDIVFHY